MAYTTNHISMYDSAITNTSIADIAITGKFNAGVSGQRYYLNRSHPVYPGTLGLTDINGAELTIEPTGNNGYLLVAPTPVRVNSRMNQAIRDHIERCLSYSKPKPNTETDDA